MVKHIVMFRLKDFVNQDIKNANLQKMKEMLEGLKNIISELKSIEVGINFNISSTAFDIVLITEFDNRADLQAYIDHPEHQKVIQFIRKIVALRYVIDFE